MAIKKQLDVFERAALDSKVHTGECLFIKDANVVVTTKVNATATSGEPYVYAYAFVIGGLISEDSPAMPAVLYDDGSLSVTLTDSSTVDVVGGTIGLQTITPLIRGSWNYFELSFDGTDLTVRINDDSFVATAEVAHDLTGADRFISDLPVGSMISGILSLWNTDVPQ